MKLIKLLFIALFITLMILFTTSYRLNEIKDQTTDRIIKNDNINLESKDNNDTPILKKNKGSYLLILEIFEDEQLTQFTQVIKQAITLASMTNRILVLPYVSDSHLIGPNKLSEFRNKNYPYFNFTFYYNIDQFDNVITMYEYEKLETFYNPIISFYADPNISSPYSINYQCNDEENDYIEYTLGSMFKSKKNICYKVDDNDYLIVSALINKFPNDPVGFAHYHKGIMSEEETNMFIPSIPFSNEIIDESIRYKKEIFNDCYIALHWRYEKTNISFIPIVLDAVIERFKEIKKEIKDKCNHIFFASEYSSNGSDSFSNEERSAKENYYKRTKRLLESIGFKITEGYHGDIKDAGGVAILDRLLCEQSTLFFAVDQSSSFTGSILNSRKDKLNDLTVFKPYFNPFEKKYYEHLRYPSKSSVSLFIKGDSSQINESIDIIMNVIEENPYLNVTIFYIDSEFREKTNNPNINYQFFNDYDYFSDNDRSIYDFIKVIYLIN